jgi:aminopeptidase N
LLRAWYLTNLNDTADTADFIALAERISRKDLDPFFQVWLYQPGKPQSW